MVRSDGRSPHVLRKTRLVRSVLRLTHGSALIRAGNTQVLCAATIEAKVPPFLKGSGRGWITAEYAMLPGAGKERVPRNKISGRGMEIQRLIGRSLRSVVDLDKLGEHTITLDCDVLEADGGTRTAAITAAYVALSEAVERLVGEGKLTSNPIQDSVAATSVGFLEGEVYLDLNHEEDTKVEVDFNLVATGSGRLVEVQGTAEHKAFSEKDLQQMVRVGLQGVKRLTRLQSRCLQGPAKPVEMLLPADRNTLKKKK